MRYALHFFAGILVALSAVHVARSQPVVIPQQVLFPSVPIGNASNASFVAIQGDATIAVTAVTYISATGAAFTTATRLPTSPSGAGRKIDIQATSTLREYSASIKVDFTVNGKAATETIAAYGIGLCTDPVNQKCDPRGPLCAIDRMKLAVAEVVDPDVDIRGRAARSEFSFAHHSALSQYSLPLDTIWKIGGLDQFVKAPACSLPPIEFTRVLPTAQVSTFTWDAGVNSPPSDSGTVSVNGVPITFSYSIPKQMHGWAQTFGSDVELHFDKSFGPHVEFSAGGTAWFTSDVDCVDSSALGSLVRQPDADYQPAPPKLHLVVVPK